MTDTHDFILCGGILEKYTGNEYTVHIPDAVSVIENSAFTGCGLIREIFIPANVREIHPMAFYGCIGIQKVHIEDIGSWCSVKGLRGSNLRKTGVFLYHNGKPVKDLVIPDSVTEIGETAFYGCSGLESVTIPESVVKIGADAFGECTDLLRVNVSGYESWCRTDIEYGGNLLSNGAALYIGSKKITDAVIPDGITEIRRGVFSGYADLKIVTIPESVRRIGNCAFSDCVNLKEVHVSDIKSWCEVKIEADGNPLSNGAGLYIGGERITDLVIPDGVTEIGKYAFYGCRGLESVTIPESVVKIGLSAFDKCEDLCRVNIPDYESWCRTDIEYGLKPLASGAGLYTGGRKITDLVIPDGITEIGSGVFSLYSDLLSVTIPASVSRIGDCAFSECVNLKEVYVSDIKNWCEAEIGMDGNPLSNGAALYTGSGKITDLEIPCGTRHIGCEAFKGCSSIESVSVPDSVSWIGNRAFDGCRNIRKLSVPERIDEIGNAAFRGCTGLADKGGFVSVNGILFDYAGSDSDVVIPGGIREISATVFDASRHPENRGIRSVTLPEGLEKIKKRAFAECSGIKRVFIPDSVYEIGTEAFRNCTRLQEIILPAGLKAVGGLAFYDCSSLEFTEIPEGVRFVGLRAFKGCDSLKTVVIPESVTAIEEGAFTSCCSSLCIVTAYGSYADRYAKQNNIWVRYM